MQQTLLGVFALILASTMSLNQKRGATANYERMVGNEIELAVTGSLTNVIEMIGSRSFDERSTPNGIDLTQNLPTAEAEFNDKSLFGSGDRGNDGCSLDKPFLTPDCDDIDDMDGLEGQVVELELSNGLILPVMVAVEIDYVIDRVAHVHSDVPTRHKRVVIRGTNPHLPGGEILIERVFSYDPLESEMDYEKTYGPIGTHDGEDASSCDDGGGGEIGDGC